MPDTEKSKIEETDLYLRVETTLPFQAVLDGVQRLSAEHGFRVLSVHDIQATLKEKGFPREPIAIVEVCNAGFAHKALAISEDVAMFMPCRFTVHTSDGKSVLTLSRPSMIAGLIHDDELSLLAHDVESRLRAVVEKFAA